MKKRILMIIMTLLLTTGCTCEYNLTIDGNSYKEEVILIGENTEEISNLDNEWEIPIDKKEYQNIQGFDKETDINTNMYSYKKSNDKLTFNYDFSGSKISNSTAVSNCYNQLTVKKYNNTTIISTSSKASCFENHPPLTSVKVAINVDRDVISNNADNVSGNTYIWNINRSNANNKSINLILDDGIENEDNQTSNDPNTTNSSSNKNNIKNKKNDYALYILLIVLLIIIFIGYKWFMKFKDENNNID